MTCTSGWTGPAMKDERRQWIEEVLEEVSELYREMQATFREVQANAATARARSAEMRQRADELRSRNSHRRTVIGNGGATRRPSAVQAGEAELEPSPDRHPT